MKFSNLKAVLIGATGLVGGEILRLLLLDERFSSILVFTRRSTSIQHPRLVEKVVDFEKFAEWKDQIQGDLAFSALGTTRKAAGGISQQFKIDYTFQYKFAEASAQRGVEVFVLISSQSALAQSKFPYLAMKGKLEDDLQTLAFPKIRILRPGPLEGVRERPRLAENLSVPCLKIISLLPGLQSFRPISGERVAKAAIASAFDPRPGPWIMENLELFAQSAPLPF